MTDSAARSAAIHAAARLPRPTVQDQDSGGYGYFIYVGVLFVGSVAWLSVTIAREISYGWLFLLAGLPTWLLVRALFLSMKGAEMGRVVVDRNGVVRVVTGMRSIRRLARMYERGAGPWMRGAVRRGIALCFGGLAGLVVATLLVGEPWPLLLFLTGALWALLHMVVLFSYVAVIQAKSDEQETLGSVELLPMLAAYGRHRGWREVANGVPADRLLDVLAEHPDDTRQIKEYVRLHRIVSTVGKALAG